MNPPKTTKARWWMWLASGILLLLLLIAFIHGVLRDSNDTFLLSDLNVYPPHPGESTTMVNAIPEIDVEQLSESLAQALARHINDKNRHNLQALEESRLAQMRMFEEWRERFGEKIEEYLLRLDGLDQKLHSIEHGVHRLLDAVEDETPRSSMTPAFTFRGIEIWHGRAHALLEHEGRILPAQEGESRLGWRIHAIDRDSRKLHVSDGMTELVLEEQ